MNPEDQTIPHGIKRVGEFLTSEDQNPTCPDCGRPEEFPRCRTCKYWSPHTYMIGVGTCVNFDALFRIVNNESFKVAQDFGCPFHTWGENYQAEISSREDRLKSINEFLNNRLDNRPKM